MYLSQSPLNKVPALRIGIPEIAFVYRCLLLVFGGSYLGFGISDNSKSRFKVQVMCVVLKNLVTRLTKKPP